MKKLIFLMIIFACPALTASADPYTAGTAFTWEGVTFSEGAVGQVHLTKYSTASSNGGAFNVYLDQGSLSPFYDGVTSGPEPVFSTFCVEEEISFSYNTLYWVTIDSVAYSGGVPGTGGDAISDITDEIYRGWVAGNYGDSQQWDVSRAIWKAEGEDYGQANAIYQDAAYALGYDADLSLAGQQYGYTGDSLGQAVATQVMNLWTIEWDGSSWVATDVQSQLIVPLPAATILGLLGLSVAGIKLRKHS